MQTKQKKTQHNNHRVRWSGPKREGGFIEGDGGEKRRGKGCKMYLSYSLGKTNPGVEALCENPGRWPRGGVDLLTEVDDQLVQRLDAGTARWGGGSFR